MPPIQYWYITFSLKRFLNCGDENSIHLKKIHSFNGVISFHKVFFQFFQSGKAAGWICLLIVLLLWDDDAFSQQNLVPNWSFEDYIQCPDMESQFDRVSLWTENGAEYYNACDVTSYVGVPYNMAGYQPASTGQAYAGIYTYSFSGSNPSFRDFIGVQLTSPLIVGTKYYVSIKVSATLNGFLPWGSSKFVSNKCGVLFKNSASVQFPIPNYAHVYTDSIISDTTSWTAIRGSFVADSAYTSLIVGNFFHDSLTAFINVNPSATFHFAYLYLDDICVSTDSMYCELLATAVQNKWKDEIQVYPNPCTNSLNVEINNSFPFSSAIATVFDINGNQVLSKALSNNDSQLATRELPPGVYLLKLQVKKESKKILFVKN